MTDPVLYFHNVTVLDADGVIGHSLRITGNRILAIGAPANKQDRRVDCHDGVMIPGLINAHDHLELNHFGRIKYRNSHTHSLQWIEDIEAHFNSDPQLTVPRSKPMSDRVLIGILKNILCGVTTVCHHNPLYQPLLQQQFVNVLQDYNYCHSLFRGKNPSDSYCSTAKDHPWMIHLAEGTDGLAQEEFDRLMFLDAAGTNTVLVHGVGLTFEQRQFIIQKCGGLIWCPGSNYFLFGQTARVQEFAAAGKLALGSDSRLTGEVDLLAELRFAGDLGVLSTQSLFHSVTIDAARMLGLNRGQGKIQAGGTADLVLLPPASASDLFFHILRLERCQLQLVMTSGRPVVGAPGMSPVFDALDTEFLPVQVDHQEKIMSRKLVGQLISSSIKEPGLEITES